MSSKIENALDCMKTRRAALHSEKNEMSGHSSTQPSLSHRLMQLKRLQVRPVLDPSSINAIQTSGSGCFHRASYTFVWIIGGPQREISRDAEREREILERRRNSKLLPALTRGTRATAGASKYLHSRVAQPDYRYISNCVLRPHFNYGNCRFELCPISGLKLIQFKRSCVLNGVCVCVCEHSSGRG